MREELINSLITRGDEDAQYRHRLHLLAVACLETSVEIGADVKAKLEKRLAALVPPRSQAEADALSLAGELAVPHLAFRGTFHSTPTARNCIRVLAKIGGEAALDSLQSYGVDAREEVVKELLHAWEAFDRKIYAERVLSQAHGLLHLKLTSDEPLDGIEYLHQLTSLDLEKCENVTDLRPLANLCNLTLLKLGHCENVTDLRPLANLTRLTELSLENTRQIRDLSPLANLTNLTSLTLRNSGSGDELRTLAALSQLSSLDLTDCVGLNDLRPLAGLGQLTSLILWGCYQIDDLSPLAELTNLTSLDLSYCERIMNLHPLAKLTSLTSLDLSYCTSITDITPLGRILHFEKFHIGLNGIFGQTRIPEGYEVIDGSIMPIKPSSKIVDPGTK